MGKANQERRFAVIVRYESENPDNQFPQDVFWHSSPRQAARRLAALINRRAKWVPKRMNVGSRFYIVDHEDGGAAYSLTSFRETFNINPREIKP